MNDLILREIVRLANEGDAHIPTKNWSEALKCYRAALHLLPTDDRGGRFSDWLHVAIGETSFFNGEYQEAAEAFAELCRDKQLKLIAPLALLRYSEALFKAGKREESAVILSQAGTNFTLEDFDDPVYWLLGQGLTIRAGAIDT